MIRQQQHRMADKSSDKVDVVDFASVPDEGDGKSANDIRKELDSLAGKVNEEHKRLESLLSGCGRGRGKSPQFEFAARSILATGCSARAAKYNLLVGARLETIIKYTVGTIKLGANILRDSVLTRLENMHFEAYVHVNAIMWKVSPRTPP